MAAADPYQLLADLAARELTLVSERRLEELEQLGSARERLIAELPATPPASARSAIARAAAAQSEVTRTLEGARADLIAELRKLDHGRTTVRGYAAAPATPSLVDRAG